MAAAPGSPAQAPSVHLVYSPRAVVILAAMATVTITILVATVIWLTVNDNLNQATARAHHQVFCTYLKQVEVLAPTLPGAGGRAWENAAQTAFAGEQC